MPRYFPSQFEVDTWKSREKSQWVPPPEDEVERQLLLPPPGWDPKRPLSSFLSAPPLPHTASFAADDFNQSFLAEIAPTPFAEESSNLGDAENPPMSSPDGAVTFIASSLPPPIATPHVSLLGCTPDEVGTTPGADSELHGSNWVVAGSAEESTQVASEAATDTTTHASSEEMPIDASDTIDGGCSVSEGDSPDRVLLTLKSTHDRNETTVEALTPAISVSALLMFQ